MTPWPGRHYLNKLGRGPLDDVIFQISRPCGIRQEDVVCCRVPWLYQYWLGGLKIFVVLCPGTLEGSTGSGSGFKASKKTGQQLKVSSDRLGEAGNRTCDPWFTRHRCIPYTMVASDKKIGYKPM